MTRTSLRGAYLTGAIILVCVYANVDLYGQSTVCIKYGCVYTNTSTNSLCLSHAAWRVNAVRLLLRVCLCSRKIKTEDASVQSGNYSVLLVACGWLY